MLFSLSNKAKLPEVAVPTFILTETCSTIALSDESELKAGDTQLSLSLDKRLADLQKSSGKANPEILKVLLSLGDACMKNGDYQESSQYYTQALDVTKKILPNGHPDIGDVLCSIGALSVQQSMPKEGISNLTAALQIYTKAMSDRTWSKETKDGSEKEIEFNLYRRLASVQSALGSCEFLLGDFKKARIHYDAALLESKRSAVAAVILDRENPNKEKMYITESRIHVSEIFNNIASVYSQQGDKATAIQNYNNALSLQMQEAGEDNPSVAATLHNIGTMHFRSGDYQFALKSYKQVLKMSRYLYGNDDIRIADSLRNISTVHEQADEIGGSVAALSAATRLTAKHYGRDSKEYAETLLVLGALYARTNQNDLALEHFESALTICKKAGLDNSNATMQSIQNAISFVQNGGNGAEEELDQESQTSVVESLSDAFACGGFCFAAETHTHSFDVKPGLADSSITNAASSSIVTV